MGLIVLSSIGWVLLGTTKDWYLPHQLCKEWLVFWIYEIMGVTLKRNINLLEINYYNPTGVNVNIMTGLLHFTACTLSSLNDQTRKCVSPSALSEVKSGRGHRHNLELLLVGVLLSRSLAYSSTVCRLSRVWTLPVPPPCSSELSFNTDKWASWAHKARAILWLRRACIYYLGKTLCCSKSPDFFVAHSADLHAHSAHLSVWKS